MGDGKTRRLESGIYNTLLELRLGVSNIYQQEVSNDQWYMVSPESKPPYTVKEAWQIRCFLSPTPDHSIRDRYEILFNSGSEGI